MRWKIDVPREDEIIITDNLERYFLFYLVYVLLNLILTLFAVNLATTFKMSSIHVESFNAILYCLSQIVIGFPVLKLKLSITP